MTTSATKAPPMLNGALPILGHALEFRNNPVRLLTRGRVHYGDVFALQMPFAKASVVMTGAKAQQKYFRLTDEDVSQAEAYQLMTPIFGKGICYDAPPQIFREQLGFFHEMLRDSKMRTYTDGFIAEANQYFDDWKDEGVVDMYDVGNELTIYTSSRSLLGNEFRQQLSGEFARLYSQMEDGLSLLAFFNPHLPIPKFIKRDRARVKLVEMITEIIEQRRRTGVRGDDMLQTLMESSYSDGRALTHDDITGLLLTIMFAGHHTSGVTFSWTGILLARHPKWLARLREEQRAVLGDRSDLTMEDLKEMPLLEATIKEVLRMYPPIIAVMRKVVNGFEYDGFEIEPGTMLFASPAVSHYMPEVFHNPQAFDPERFLPERAEDKVHASTWIAFGAGRHRCMGIVFAQLQLRALWSHLLRNFDFELMDDVYEPDYSRLLVGPRHPCRLKYRRLHKTRVAMSA